MKNIIIFSRYDRAGASSRYRLYLIKEELKLNYNFIFYPLISKSILYEKIIYKSYRKKILPLIFRYVIRIFQILKLKKTDIIIIEKELFPMIPTIIFEKILKKKTKKLVIDFDDGIHVNYQKKILSLFFNNKIGSIIKKADKVIVGSKNLEDYAKKYNNNVNIISTLVKNFEFKKLEKFNIFTIIWIGSYSTLKSIKNLIKKIDQIEQPQEIQLIILGAYLDIEINNVKIINPEWSEENENYYLERSHIGIIDIEKDDFSYYKCSHKVTKYFSAKLPVIGNNYGENKNLIVQGQNGYLFNTYNESLKFINMLRNNDIYLKMSKNVQTYFEKNLSTERLSKLYLDIFD